MTHELCPLCSGPLGGSVAVSLGGKLRVCGHCRGFLIAAEDGFRSLLPGDLERLPEELRWQLFRARAGLCMPSS